MNLDIEQAKEIRNTCIKAFKEGFMDASMSGLCEEGALEAAIGSVQSLNLELLVEKITSAK
ncbi:MAG: acetyltransferase [Balneolaceae bacterium]